MSSTHLANQWQCGHEITMKSATAYGRTRYPMYGPNLAGIGSAPLPMVTFRSCVWASGPF